MSASFQLWKGPFGINATQSSLLYTDSCIVRHLVTLLIGQIYIFYALVYLMPNLICMCSTLFFIFSHFCDIDNCTKNKNNFYYKTISIFKHSFSYRWTPDLETFQSHIMMYAGKMVRTTTSSELGCSGLQLWSGQKRNAGKRRQQDFHTMALQFVSQDIWIAIKFYVCIYCWVW